MACHVPEQSEWYVVGEAGFEPATSASRTLRAKPAALLPDADTLYRERGNNGRRYAAAPGEIASPLGCISEIVIVRRNIHLGVSVGRGETGRPSDTGPESAAKE